MAQEQEQPEPLADLNSIAKHDVAERERALTLYNIILEAVAGNRSINTYRPTLVDMLRAAKVACADTGGECLVLPMQRFVLDIDTEVAALRNAHASKKNGASSFQAELRALWKSATLRGRVEKLVEALNAHDVQLATIDIHGARRPTTEPYVYSTLIGPLD